MQHRDAHIHRYSGISTRQSMASSVESKTHFKSFLDESTQIPFGEMDKQKQQQLLGHVG